MAVGRKYRLIITLLYFACCGGKGFAQGGVPDFAETDSVSYSLYTAGKWTELARYCTDAINNGYDYYYLRMRAGVAYFEKRRYRAAAIQFEKALAFNSGDPAASEYLYYAYLYSGRKEQARWLSRSFDTALAASAKTLKLPPIAFIMAEGGVKISDSSARFGNATYAQAAVSHYVAGRLSLFHALTYYGQNEQRFNVQQFQYFINAALPLKHNFMLSAGIHYIYDNADVKKFKMVESVSTVTETMYPPPGSPPPPPGQQPGTYTVAVHSVSLQPYYLNRRINNYVAAVTLVKHMALFDLSLGGTASFLDTVTQCQLNGGITWYPFENNRLGISANIYAHDDNRVKRASIAVSPAMSAMIGKRTGASLAYFINNGLNISEQNGYLVNNSPDYTTERYTASLSYAMFKKVYIYGTYGFENKKVLTKTFKYNYNIFLLGIRLVPS